MVHGMYEFILYTVNITMNIQFTIVPAAELLPKSPGKVIHILG